MIAVSVQGQYLQAMVLQKVRVSLPYCRQNSLCTRSVYTCRLERVPNDNLRGLLTERGSFLSNQPCNQSIYLSINESNIKQGVALTGRNRTGPPCSVGRPTAHAPYGRQRYRQRRTPVKSSLPVYV